MAQSLGPVLCSYHPCVLDNVNRLCAISGMEEVSFHMSGTEAVMQAVRMARYVTGKKKLVRFAGAYNGWWDDVQPGPGNPMPPSQHTLTLREIHEGTLRVLRTRNDIACVLINPLQAMHPNAAAPSDSTLVANERKINFDKAAYTQWLHQLRQVCDERGIALILDEVFLGFRLAAAGAQEYFGIQADLVTYGKTLGGGLPVGVVCGKSKWMRRYRNDHPAQLCFARGTFNAHPYVMAAMNAFLQQHASDKTRQLYTTASETWRLRMEQINQLLEQQGLPIRFAGMETVWSLVYLKPSRYNWMLQFYMREQGIALSWVGTGRFIFNFGWTDDDFQGFTQSVLVAAQAMKRDGWWWTPGDASIPAIKKRLLLEMLKSRFGLLQ
jgi:glutamate-1-semialdehyde 2,1-aminomutase